MTTADHGSNAAALEATLAELGRLGRLETIDVAQVQALRSMATALDAAPTSPSLWRQYLATLKEVRSDGGDTDRGLEDALAEIRGTSEVGDSASS